MSEFRLRSAPAESGISDPAWRLARDAARLLAADPAGLGGAWIRSQPDRRRDAWFAVLKGALPASRPIRRVPLHITEDRLFGGLDLAATLAAGRPIRMAGMMGECRDGLVVLASAERCEAALLARIAQSIDADGVGLSGPAVVVCDESFAGDEADATLGNAGALLDRLAFLIDLEGSGSSADVEPRQSPESDQLRSSVSPVAPADVEVPEKIVAAIAATAAAFGIASLRAPLLALRAARGLAALDGRLEVSESDASRAAQLVLAPRATQLPAPESDAEEDDVPPPPDEDRTSSDDDDLTGDTEQHEQPPLEDQVLEAVRAAIPAGLLAALTDAMKSRDSRSAGRFGADVKGQAKGRPAGVRAGMPGGGKRLDVIATLTAAAPWQRLRRQTMGGDSGGSEPRARVQVRKSDFRIITRRQRSETATIFVVDASGSSALHRMAEAKGAVEMLLADCYVRRDHVGLIAFRGAAADVLLQPTRSLARAKRALSGLPGGGGTPLAAAIDTATALASAASHRGQTPSVVVLTDGRANIARDGGAGRPRASADADEAAAAFRETGFRALVIDTSQHPAVQARRLADNMGATYLALPHADAAVLSSAVRSATQDTRPARRA